MGGSDGIRGHVVMRNNKLIWNAGISGVLSGIGSAMQQSTTTQAISPLGITSAIKSGKTFESGAYGGANSALGKLADYYIKLADMYHPIVQVHAGSEVNIVFLKGFSLTEGQGTMEPISGQTTEQVTENTAYKASDNNNQEAISSTSSMPSSSNFTQTIKNSHLGQGIDREMDQEVNTNNNIDSEELK